jgi:hypothetical protein
MASTYPLEVVMAERWVKEHEGLQRDQLNAELDKQDWDPSVKALVPFPQILAMMSEKLEWTEKLGNAFLDQQDAVMDEIQKLRERAKETGNLKSGKEQTVTTEGNIIAIEPVNPEVIYVPIYNCAIVYGPWWYPDYPPFCYYPPGYAVAGIIFYFPFFCLVGPSWIFAWGHWGWYHHRLYVNVDRHININNVNIRRADVRTDPWQHNPINRRGVSYRNDATSVRYGQSSRGSLDSRRIFRGFSPGPNTSTQPQVTPQTVPQNRGFGGFEQGRLEQGGGRTIFGGMEGGSDVRRQSERGFQSRGSIKSPQSGGVGPRGGGSGGGGHGGGGGSRR